ncbi:MAG: type 4a pilus biogenesis protein PilO [Candidatus Cloacimonetes bacterium]|nr:type 4a pilus biogenesis protein PilO [Candidatus Cloacimonadota bacterium]
MKQRYLILLGAIVIVTFLFIYSANAMINNKTRDIRRIDAQIRRAQERLNSAKVMDEQLSQVSRVIDNTLISEQSFSPEEINAFVRTLAELADRNQIAVFSLIPRSAHSPANLVEHQFVMDIMCTYVQLGRFLTRIESLDYIVKVNTLDVKPVRSGVTELEVDGELVTQYRVIVELSVFKIVKEG